MGGIHPGRQQLANNTETQYPTLEMGCEDLIKMMYLTGTKNVQKCSYLKNVNWTSSTTC